MAQSETIGKLAEALSKAQAAYLPLKKGRTAKLGTYSYQYADLADLFESVRPALAANGLALVQATALEPFRLVTSLLHSSGEWISSEMPLPAGLKAQDLGSQLTYSRRYAASAILGLASEDDDDGAAAHAATPSRATAPIPPAQPPTKPPAAPVAPKPATSQETPAPAPFAEPESWLQDWILWASQERARVGDEAYYRVLSQFDTKHSNQVRTKSLATKIYKVLVALPGGVA